MNPLLPHCPNPSCIYFDESELIPNWYYIHGRYCSKINYGMPRFRCRECGKTFGHTTFSIDYYVKKRVDYSRLMAGLCSGSGLWDITRFTGHSVDVILNRFERLARAAIAVHSDIMADLNFGENLVMDGFESFSVSQFYPNNINIVAGSKSEFLYSLGYSGLRRKGAKTEKQKLRQIELEKTAKAHPEETKWSVQHILEHLFTCLKQKLGEKDWNRTLFTDKHRDYPRAMEEIEGFAGKILHVAISSKLTRNHANPLFPVNYADRQFRKDLSDHVRETVKFAHCPSAMMSRMTVYQLFHNCLVSRRLKAYRRMDDSTHAEAAGLEPDRLSQILESRMSSRPFLSKLNIDSEMEKTWRMGWKIPGGKLGRYVPKFIAA